MVWHLHVVVRSLKGILPVYAYMHGLPGADIWITFVLAAPVAGHIFPVFHRFRGGKGIAVSFGVLLGLYPYMKPVLLLASCFLLFSFVIVITPNYHKTFATYLLRRFSYCFLEKFLRQSGNDSDLCAGTWQADALPGRKRGN